MEFVVDGCDVRVGALVRLRQDNFTGAKMDGKTAG